MATRKDLIDWVYEAVESVGPCATFVDVARHIWRRHRTTLQRSRDLYYTWQIDVRRIAPWLDGSPDEQRPLYDVFISHSSADNEVAALSTLR